MARKGTQRHGRRGKAFAAPRPPILVGIAGGSGSGKSRLATQLQRRLGRRAALLSLDDFYLDRSHLTPGRRARINFDHPRAIDWFRLQKVLETLRRGKSALLPCYHFPTHCRLRRQKRLEPAPIILIEGLWTLRSRSVRRLLDVRVFIECSRRTRLSRRLQRDLALRGRTALDVRRQFAATVDPMHRRFVAPQARWADLVLREKWGDREVSMLTALLNLPKLT